VYRKQEMASAPTTSILVKPKVFLDQAFLLNLWQKIKGIAAGEGYRKQEMASTHSISGLLLIIRQNQIKRSAAEERAYITHIIWRAQSTELVSVSLS
jgi:hypothetical protein